MAPIINKNKNWWIRHKCPYLMNTWDLKYQQKSKSISSSQLDLVLCSFCYEITFTGPPRKAKGGFFSESAMRFSNLQISKKIYSKSLSCAWNLNKLFTVMGGQFKFQVQDSDLEFFFLRFGDLKKTSHFLKISYL
jgi:hypothetical protein